MPAEVDHGIIAHLPSDLIQRGYGEKRGDVWFLSPEEALFLLEAGRIDVEVNGRPVSARELASLLNRAGLACRYAAYSDLRSRGLVVRSGAKYGVDFRVYEKGIDFIHASRADREHSHYLVHAVRSSHSLSLRDLLGKIRVANSVRKKLWLAVVDDDLGVTYVQAERITP